MTKYAIANKDKTVWVYQNKGSYTLTTDKARALIFDSKPAAEAVFKSNLSKLIKSKGVTVQTVGIQIEGAEDKPEPKVIVTSLHSSPSESSKYIISVLSEAVSKLNVRHQELAEQQSKFDGRVTDIEHYIEFNTGKLNACDGYKAYKLLQETLLERRKIKDELQMIQVVRDKMNAEDIANVEQKISELEARTYKPRELTYLFEKEK
jgi:hypothetical protein